MPGGEGRSCLEQFAGGLPFSGRFPRGWNPKPEGLGAGCGDGGGGRAAVFPRTFRKPPVRRGKGAEQGAWVFAGGGEWGRGSPGPPRPPCRPPGSELESGSNRLFKLPSVCGGRGARRAGSDFSRFAPSPPRRSAHAPAPRLEAGWGSGSGGGTFCAFGEEGRKLANEGQKRWGRRNYFF